MTSTSAPSSPSSRWTTASTRRASRTPRRPPRRRAADRRQGGVRRTAGTWAPDQLLASLGLGALAVGAAKYGVETYAANEKASISFTTMLGSAEKAQSFLDKMKDFAATTPFEFPSCRLPLRR